MQWQQCRPLAHSRLACWLSWGRTLMAIMTWSVIGKNFKKILTNWDHPFFFLPIYNFAIRQPLHRHDSQSQNLSTALPARGCHALQRVIGWELSCTYIVMSWSQRRGPKHDGLADRWGSTCHAYGRKFAIKIQCQWDEKYVNLKMKT